MCKIATPISVIHYSPHKPNIQLLCTHPHTQVPCVDLCTSWAIFIQSHNCHKDTLDQLARNRIAAAGYEAAAKQRSLCGTGTQNQHTSVGRRTHVHRCCCLWNRQNAVQWLLPYCAAHTLNVRPSHSHSFSHAAFPPKSSSDLSLQQFTHTSAAVSAGDAKHSQVLETFVRWADHC